MEKNNRKRLLKLLEILKRNSDYNHKLSMNDILSLLQENGIDNTNRKTIYEDIKLLNEEGYDVEYDHNGYYLVEAPFSLAEIKLIQDSLSSLKNLDNNLLDNLNNKLYSYISYDEEELLKKLLYINKHKDKKLLQRLEFVLEAIENRQALKIKRKRNNKEEIIFPLFIQRANDYYYFYYHYLDNNKIYHYRFDNLIDISLYDLKDNLNIYKEDIIKTINSATNSYFKDKVETVNIELLNDNESINERFLDDFDNVIKTKDGFSIKVSVNDIFFSKLTSYGNNIKIKNKDIALKYKDFLNNILNNYLPLK